MVLGKSLLAAIAASAMLVSTAKGHGYMTAPKVEFTFNGDNTQYMATIDASKSGFSGIFGGSPTDNTANFNKGFAASKYKSLKEFMNDKMILVNEDFTKECGYTKPDATPQPLPKTYVEWSHGAGEGFTLSHEGPCEVYCDETRVFQDDNCPKNFPAAPAKLPFDHDACLGSSQLSIYWIALHSPSWQVYINCAPLEKTTSTGAKSKFAVGGGGSSTTPSTGSSSTAQTTDDSSQTTDASSSTEQTTDAPTTPTTYAPADTEAPSTPESPATEAPSTPESPATEVPAAPESPATEAPAPTEAPATDAPAGNTGASQTSDDTSKCTVRRRRHLRN